MTYQNFIDETIETLIPRFPTETDIRSEIILKNNGISPKALIISEPGSNVFPTIYLDEFYNRVENGESTKDVASDIYDVYERHKIEGMLDVSCLSDFEKIKHRIVYRLVNRDRNAELLKKVPWEPYLDLALVYCINFECPKEVYAGSVVHLEHLNSWDISTDTLRSHALENTHILMKPDLRALPDFLNEIAGEVIMDEGDRKSYMHVLTNEIRAHGAVCLTYPGIIKEFAGEMESDVFILPSSIHEVMLLADDGNTTMEELNKLVNEVNETQVDPVEILSDHAYVYRRELDKIEY